MVSLRFAPCQGIQKQASRARSTAESRLNASQKSLTEKSIEGVLGHLASHQQLSALQLTITPTQPEPV
jgi:hypothetical protein